MTAAEFAERVGARRNGSGWMARCPAHEDHKPSLKIDEGRAGGVVVHCFAGCSTEDVCQKLGIELRDLAPPKPERNGHRHIAARYPYHDADGTHLFDVLRFEPKAFAQAPANGKRGAGAMEGVRRVLYNLPAVAQAVQAGGVVWVCEGEKDTDRLAQVLVEVGAAATTNPGGAGKWRSEYSEALRGSNVVIVADRDEPGREHAASVARMLDGVAASVCIVESAEGKDASDHLAAGRGLGEFQQVRWASDAPDAPAGSLASERATALLRSPIERSSPTPQQQPDAATAFDADAVAPFALPLGEFLDKPRPVAEPLAVDSDGRPVLARKSLIMLGARGGRGKTTHSIDWLIHLALGQDYLCFTIPEPIRVLIIENEGPEEAFAEKLRDRVSYLSDADRELVRDRIHVYSFDWGGFNLAAMTDQLVAYIDEHGFDLIFGDPLDSLGIEGVGSPEDTRKFLGLMKQAGLHSRIAWWLNTHPRKEETREAIDEISGAWGGKPDTIMLLDLLGDDRSRVRFPKIRWAKRGKRPNILLAFDADTETFSYIGEETEEERDYLGELVDRFGDGEWRTVKEIAATKDDGGIGAGEKTVKRVIEEHPDVFRSCTGVEAAQLGRSSTATLWNLAPEAES
jgi:hypothetical protein